LRTILDKRRATQLTFEPTGRDCRHGSVKSRRRVDDTNKDKMRATQGYPSLTIFYMLLIGVGSLLAHLAAEFAAMGSDADSVLFSPRHLYLGLAALAGIVIFVACGRALLHRATSKPDLKRMLSNGLEALPFGARGVRYYALTAGLQLAIGALTQIGEGCPFCSHDVIAGILGAMLTVLLLAFVTRGIGRQLPRFVSALAGYVPRAFGSPSGTFLRRVCTTASAGPGVWFPLLFNRPPPRLQSLPASA